VASYVAVVEVMADNACNTSVAYNVVLGMVIFSEITEKVCVK